MCLFSWEQSAFAGCDYFLVNQESRSVSHRSASLFAVVWWWWWLVVVVLYLSSLRRALSLLSPLPSPLPAPLSSSSSLRLFFSLSEGYLELNNFLTHRER